MSAQNVGKVSKKDKSIDADVKANKKEAKKRGIYDYIDPLKQEAKMTKKEIKAVQKEAAAAKKEMQECDSKFGIPLIPSGTVIETTKGLKKFTPEQITTVQLSMIALEEAYKNDCSLETLRNHYDLLIDAKLVKEPCFSRMTGQPKLKRVLTKKGREAYTLFFPKQSSPEVMTAD